MARIFITGSADGLGRMAGELLLEQGHTVVLHARNDQRAEQTRQQVPGAEAVLTGNLTSIAETRTLAEKANNLGPFDAVIHNAGVGYQEPRKITTEDNLPHVFQVNTLAPYILTALIKKPKRLVYLSSGLHRQGDPSLKDLTWDQRPWQGTPAYCDTKFHDVLLAFGIARLWPGVLSNSVEPGWVATKMGGQNASDDLDQGHRTQAWLAVSSDPSATVTGQHFYHLKQREPKPETRNTALQDKLLAECARLSGIPLPS